MLRTTLGNKDTPFVRHRKFFQGLHRQSSLPWLLRVTGPSARIARWKLRLSEFDGMQVLYKPGTWKSISDMLSRLETESPAISAEDIEPAVFSVYVSGDILKDYS